MYFLPETLKPGYGSGRQWDKTRRRVLFAKSNQLSHAKKSLHGATKYRNALIAQTVVIIRFSISQQTQPLKMTTPSFVHSPVDVHPDFAGYTLCNVACTLFERTSVTFALNIKT